MGQLFVLDSDRVHVAGSTGCGEECEQGRPGAEREIDVYHGSETVVFGGAGTVGSGLMV